MAANTSPGEQQPPNNARTILSPSQRESLLQHLFEPIQSSLNTLKNATKHQIPDKAERAKLLRRVLLKTGNHIQKLASSQELQDNDLSEEALWEYAVRWWPNKEASAFAVQDMYQRIVAVDQEDNASKAQTAGSTGGEASKSGQGDGGAGAVSGVEGSEEVALEKTKDTSTAQAAGVGGASIFGDGTGSFDTSTAQNAGVGVASIFGDGTGSFGT